jgi:hypothetical protein
MEELVIDETNFNEYFFDTRKHRPKKGQIMAKFTAVAEFVDGDLKRDVLHFLKDSNPESAVKLFAKLGNAKAPDDIRVCREMTEDILNGLTDQEILDKSYKFIVEYFYYTKKEYVPFDPHWQTIDLLFDREDLNEQIKNLRETDENNNEEE